jgi:hypothetical protein
MAAHEVQTRSLTIRTYVVEAESRGAARRLLHHALQDGRVLDELSGVEFVNIDEPHGEEIR